MVLSPRRLCVPVHITQFIAMMEPTYNHNGTAAMKHSNLYYQPPSSNASVYFYWAPFVANITSTVVKEGLGGKMDLIVGGSAAWDALYMRDVGAYQVRRRGSCSCVC